MNGKFKILKGLLTLSTIRLKASQARERPIDNLNSTIFLKKE